MDGGKEGVSDAAQSHARVEDDGRRPWSTPVVIVSEMRHAGAHVALGSDGTDSDAAHYQYGS